MLELDGPSSHFKDVGHAEALWGRGPRRGVMRTWTTPRRYEDVDHATATRPGQDVGDRTAHVQDPLLLLLRCNISSCIRIVLFQCIV